MNGDAILDLLYGLSYVDAEAVMTRAVEGKTDRVYRQNMATIERIQRISPIQGADFIEYAEVGHGNIRFGTVVKKDDFVVGDQCVMFAPDAILPPASIFAFMEPYGWKVRMKRFKGVPSEVVALPLYEIFPDAGTDELEDGTDVTPWLGVTKFEKTYPEDSGIAGAFPPYAPKTSEPLFQTVPHLVAALEGVPSYVSVKCDGFSETVMWVNGTLMGCSRTALMEDGEGLVWKMIRKYNLGYKLNDLGMNLAIQFEAVGPGINGNPMMLKEQEIRVFSIYDIDDQKYLGIKDLLYLCKKLELPTVEIIIWDTPFEFTSADDLRTLAEGTYPGTNKQREGIVIRPMEEMLVNNERVSFKVINLRYKG